MSKSGTISQAGQCRRALGCQTGTLAKASTLHLRGSCGFSFIWREDSLISHLVVRIRHDQNSIKTSGWQITSYGSASWTHPGQYTASTAKASESVAVDANIAFRYGCRPTSFSSHYHYQCPSINPVPTLLPGQQSTVAPHRNYCHRPNTSINSFPNLLTATMAAMDRVCAKSIDDGDSYDRLCTKSIDDGHRYWNVQYLLMAMNIFRYIPESTVVWNAYG